MATRKEAIRQREQGKAAVRALYLSELEDIGAQRAAALKAAEEQIDRVSRVLQSALDAGFSLSEIARLTEVSRPTLYQLRARQTAAADDIRLAIFQSIANHGVIYEGTLREHLATDPAKFRQALDVMVREGLLTEDFNDDPDEPDMQFALTPAGLAELSNWSFDEDDIARVEP